MSGFPYVAVFTGMLGFGVTIILCTVFCKACEYARQEDSQRAERRARSVYFIPFPQTQAPPDAEVPPVSPPPSVGPPGHFGPPPAYSELGIKPDDLPPAYSEQILPAYSFMAPPPPHMDTPQSPERPGP